MSFARDRRWNFAHVFYEPRSTPERRVCVFFLSLEIWDSLRPKQKQVSVEQKTHSPPVNGSTKTHRTRGQNFKIYLQKKGTDFGLLMHLLNRGQGEHDNKRKRHDTAKRSNWKAQLVGRDSWTNLRNVFRKKLGCSTSIPPVWISKMGINGGVSDFVFTRSPEETGLFWRIKSSFGLIILVLVWGGRSVKGPNRGLLYTW